MGGAGCDFPLGSGIRSPSSLNNSGVGWGELEPGAHGSYVRVSGSLGTP